MGLEVEGVAAAAIAVAVAVAVALAVGVLRQQQQKQHQLQEEGDIQIRASASTRTYERQRIARVLLVVGCSRQAHRVLGLREVCSWFFFEVWPRDVDAWDQES